MSGQALALNDLRILGAQGVAFRLFEGNSASKCRIMENQMENQKGTGVT